MRQKCKAELIKIQKEFDIKISVCDLAIPGVRQTMCFNKQN